MEKSSEPLIRYEVKTVIKEVPVSAPESLTRKHSLPFLDSESSYEELEDAMIQCAVEVVACNLDKEVIESLPQSDGEENDHRR